MFGAEQVARTQVGEGVIADEVGGLGAFAGAGAAEEEDDCDLLGGEAGLLLVGHDGIVGLGLLDMC